MKHGTICVRVTKSGQNLVAFLEQKESLVKAIRRGGQLSGFGLELKRQWDYS